MPFVCIADKDSWVRPRNAAFVQEKADEAEFVLQMITRAACNALTLQLVLLTQPRTKPATGMLGNSAVRFTNGTLTEVIRPTHHSAIEHRHLLSHASLVPANLQCLAWISYLPNLQESALRQISSMTETDRGMPRQLRAPDHPSGVTN